MICSHFIKPIQNLQNGDHALRLQFCNWLCEHWRLHKYTFYLEMRLTITSIAIELITKLQNRFIVNVWCGMLGDWFVLNELLNGERYLQFLKGHLPEILSEITLNVRQRMYCQRDGTRPHSNQTARLLLSNNLFISVEVHTIRLLDCLI